MAKARLRLREDINPDEIHSVKDVSDYVLEITFMDDTVKQVDFSYLMKNSRGGKFADIKLFKSYRVQAEMISWGKGEIMVFCSSLYEAKRKVYKGISLGF